MPSMPLNARPFLVLAASLTMAACAQKAAPPPQVGASGGPPTAAPVAQHAAAPTASVRTHENLNAVLWMQTAVEFRAMALQLYRLAQVRLDQALADKSWTAALEQTGDFASLPPAVILDIDETVLDNSPYQARGVRDETAFDEATTWQAWCREAKALAVPGAVEFTQAAAKKGVAVFFITNRMHAVEEPTRRNLSALGVPLDPARDTVLTRNEKPEWGVSDKTLRRRAIAERFRVLLLVGDDFGDFVGASRGSPEDRRKVADANDRFWGERWIALPNPAYGSWEGALTAGLPAGASQADRQHAKYARLRTDDR